jgi:chromosome segregation ATPase
MDEATMYKSAIAMAGTLGANKEQILSAADHYMEVLVQEEAKFNQALTANKQKIALSEQNGIASLEQNIVSKQKQVENLLAEIEKEKLKLEELKNDIAASAQKIAQTAANFNAAYQLVAGQIADDVRKIKEYIN